MPEEIIGHGSTTFPNIPRDEVSDKEAKELPEKPGEELPEEVREELAKSTLEGKWQEVVDMYNDFPAAQTAAIDDAMNTALHVAVDLDEEQEAEKLVNVILKHNEHVRDLWEEIGAKERCPELSTEEEMVEALEVVNKRGDTPLHVAASRGFAKICEFIIGNKGERLYLVHLKNKQGETPLFLAALNWHKEAFAYLSYVSSYSISTRELVRENGDSILHCAIKREYFDLAVIIMDYYGFLLGFHTNNDGFTPLKVLATRPSAFRSGTKLSRWKLILYHFKAVEPLDAEATMGKILTKFEQPRSEEMTLPKKAFSVADLFGKLLCWRRKYEHDEENASKSLEKYEAGFLLPNYATIQQFVKSAYKHSLGRWKLALEEVEKTKNKHQWSGQLLDALMESPYEAITGKRGGSRNGTPTQNDSKKQTKSDDCNLKPPGSANDTIGKTETSFLMAARHGIVEMVIKIQCLIPSVIHHTNSKKQNVLLVAVKNRQPQIVKELKKSKKEVWNNLILGVDDDENTVLHLAAEASGGEKRWQIAGSALQMMWDIKWYQYIKSIVPEHCYFRTNKDSKTPGQIFKKSHEELVQKSSEWLKETSESCSLVAALVAGVSFATASSVPGGTNDEGKPPLEGQPAFDAFAIASLVGLCFSITGLIMFLSILTSRKEARDFRRGLPLKLLVGLSSLFVSIIAMFVSFCSGHFFIINHKYKTLLFPFYVVTSIPVAVYALGQFPLYFDLFATIITEAPGASDTGDTL